MRSFITAVTAITTFWGCPLLVYATRAYLFSPGAASLEHGVEHGEGHGDLVAPVQLNEAGYDPQTEIRVLERVGENVAGIADRSGLPDAS